jgi:VanZ family protein
MRTRLLIRSGVLRWGPALLLMTVIFMLSSIPSQRMPAFDRYDLLVKKFGHFTGYALLAQTFLRGLGRNDLKSIGFAWILAALYGASDELHQAFVPGRQSTLIDVGIDALGALAVLFPSLVRRLRSAR